MCNTQGSWEYSCKFSVSVKLLKNKNKLILRTNTENIFSGGNQLKPLIDMVNNKYTLHVIVSLPVLPK